MNQSKDPLTKQEIEMLRIDHVEGDMLRTKGGSR